MAQTNIRGKQIQDGTVQRSDLDTTTIGQAVIAKLIQGSNVTLSSTGGDSGTGDVTISAPDGVSTDANNLATLGTDSRILVPASSIWSARLRSFNAVGNPSFEVDQANVNATLTNAANGVRLADRHWLAKVGTMTVNTQVVAAAANTGIALPGTNFYITRNFLRTTLTAQETSLGVSDQLGIYQNIEGPYFREILGDVFSLSVLVRCSVPLKFGLNLRDSPGTQSINALGTIGSANTWTLITVPNLPVCPSGNFTGAAGAVGQVLRITLAAGSSLTAGTNNVWGAGGTLVGALGQDNFAAQAVNTTFDIAFIQLEPGSQCTTLIDKPFSQNLFECRRYYQKNAPYGTLPCQGNWKQIGTVTTTSGGRAMVRFEQDMAKQPTLRTTGNTTALGNVYADGCNPLLAPATLGAAGSSGIQGVTFSPVLTTAATFGSILSDWDADTGW